MHTEFLFQNLKGRDPLRDMHIYESIHAQIDINPAYIAPIPPQTYTGKPIFIIPEVKLTETKNENTETETEIELVFMRDFNVFYKNNINKGTATITIKGIGKYKGEIITTFNIIKN